jgi:hypothetical protein
VHHPRCLDPKSQDNSISHPEKNEINSGNCRLGDLGHCLKCPYRGLKDARWIFIQSLNMWAAAAQRWGSRTELLEKMPKDIQSLLFPPTELEFIEREDAWAKRAKYHAVIHTNELIKELLREIHDLHNK